MKTYILGINIDNEEKEVLFIDAENYTDLIKKYETHDERGSDFDYDVFDVQSFPTQIKYPTQKEYCFYYDGCTSPCDLWKKLDQESICIIK